MSSSVAVSTLLDRVRATAPSRSGEDLRSFLAIEVALVDEASANDPGGWAEWADGTDVPGTAYEALLPAPARRAQGQFQTPFWAADLMGRWLLAQPTKTLFDPAVGSARLLFRAFEHGQYKPERFVGWDIDPLLCAMAALNLRLREVPKYHISKADFLLEDPRLDDDGLVERPPDATIANAPYSRHQALDADYKQAIHEQIEEQLGIRISRRAGLHALFLLRALAIAAPTGRLAFITPAGWLDADYGKEVKGYITSNAAVEAMVFLGGEKFFFDGARTTAAITLLRKGAVDGEAPTRIVNLGGKRPPVDAVLAAVRGEGSSLKVREVTLRPSARWSRPAVRLPQGQPLGELAAVRRGIATGYNSFFVLSEARRLELDLGRHVLRPCLYRPRLVPGRVVERGDLEALDDDVPRWLLDPPTGQTDDGDDPLALYLAWGRKELAAHERYLTSNRKPWFRIEKRSRCEIVVPYMNKTDARFIRNRVGALPLNTFHVIEPNEPDRADTLWAALNQDAVLRQLHRLGREYGNGLWKIEPGDLRRVRVRLS